MHSGIGNAQILADKGIHPVHHLFGVGENLQDHFYTHSVYSCTPDSSLNKDFSSWRQLLHGIQYLLTHKGALTMGASQAVAFVKALPDSQRADTQINFKPVTWERKPDGSVSIIKTPEFSAASCFLRPYSRGRVGIRSNDPMAAPVICANYLGAEKDKQAVLNSFRIARSIFSQPALRGRVKAENLPGALVQDDDALMGYVRRYGASMHHWVGTCSMGSDEDAVVDERLRVHGIASLRVADASVFPLIPSTNTNAPTFMLADRAAKLILEDVN
ncbi:Alcohol dehydrogenase [acceptor] [bioreactor metagenome]|uniref:Alcohol dehydrogenase [acceptor] n=1 Tax=bioreactor metagenome TaxID=1076179 RepID=A0A645C1L2_9ZZZZ